VSQQDKTKLFLILSFKKEKIFGFEKGINK
jgi:hypothetical protein